MTGGNKRKNKSTFELYTFFDIRLKIKQKICYVQNMRNSSGGYFRESLTVPSQESFVRRTCHPHPPSFLAHTNFSRSEIKLPIERTDTARDLEPVDNGLSCILTHYRRGILIKEHMTLPEKFNTNSA